MLGSQVTLHTSFAAWVLEIQTQVLVLIVAALPSEPSLQFQKS